MIPREEWKYRGLAGHFIAADKCLFHLCTDIGKYRVSTVGAYYPKGPDHSKMEQIGSGRHYETMVFELANGEILKHEEVDGEGLRHELGMQPYETDKLAEEMHERMCFKWAGGDAMTFEMGPKIKWDPLDESEQNMELGRIFFGHQLERVIEMAKEGLSQGVLLVADVDKERGIVTLKAGKEAADFGQTMP